MVRYRITLTTNYTVYFDKYGFDINNNVCDEFLNHFSLYFSK